MCRLYGFIATEPTKVECSLIRAQNALLKQSRLDSRGFTHPDGWGIAYYVNALPVVERRSRAAYQDLRFDAAAKLVHARIVVAHVRAASVGVPSTANTSISVAGSSPITAPYLNSKRLVLGSRRPPRRRGCSATGEELPTASWRSFGSSVGFGASPLADSRETFPWSRWSGRCRMPCCRSRVGAEMKGPRRPRA